MPNVKTMHIIPEYSYGRCKVCGVKGELGDGLCRECWDGIGNPEGNRAMRVRRNKVIRQLLKQGWTKLKLAERFNLTPRSIRLIEIYGKTEIPNYTRNSLKEFPPHTPLSER